MDQRSGLSSIDHTWSEVPGFESVKPRSVKSSYEVLLFNSKTDEVPVPMFPVETEMPE